MSVGRHIPVTDRGCGDKRHPDSVLEVDIGAATFDNLTKHLWFAQLSVTPAISGFGVWGLGFRVWGLGFFSLVTPGISGFGVWSLEFGV